MHRVLKIGIIVLIICCFVTPSLAGWSVYKRVQVKSKEKHTLRFDKHSGGAVRIWFILRHERKGVFATGLILYKVNDHPVRGVKGARKIKVSKDRWLSWEIDDGQGKPDEGLLEFMDGDSVVFQYYLPDGEIKETIFSLEGAREAIEELLK